MYVCAGQEHRMVIVFHLSSVANLQIQSLCAIVHTTCCVCKREIFSGFGYIVRYYCVIMKFTPQEYADMIVAYGLAQENAHAAARIYSERFPGRDKHPSGRVILRAVQKLRETGCLEHNCGRGAREHDLGVREEEQILDTFAEDPRNSVRRVARQLNLSRNAVHRVLHINSLHPYHHQRVQQLLPGDHQQRVNFCEGFLAQYRRDDTYPDLILWTDEATFTPNGVFNSHNFVYWGEENPHVTREGAFQHRWSINVWAGMNANRVIGPYFLPPRLNGDIYADFLENELPVLLADVPLDVRKKLIFQHDGAPAHFRRDVRAILDARYPDRWMGRGGPITWPARSPDLNVLDFFVWGYIKNLVEHRRHSREDEVREAIIAAFDTITPDMAHRATRNIVRRAEICLQERGRHFEQLLH